MSSFPDVRLRRFRRSAPLRALVRETRLSLDQFVMPLFVAPEPSPNEALPAIRPRFPELVLVTDVCLCEYTSHGHCGVIVDGDVHNDQSLELLARTAVSHAEAGADVVAPSDMMDGRVAAIREALDDHGLEKTPVLA